MSEVATKTAKAVSDKASKLASSTMDSIKANAKSPAGIAFQIIVGFLIVLFIYWISLKALNSDALSNASLDTNKKSIVNIISGYAESSQVSRHSYNTVNSFSAAYLPLNPSVNIKGGAQFTYSLWLYVGNPTLAAASHNPIFMRGDATKYNYTKTGADKSVQAAKDYVAMCPLLEFGSNPMDFNIRFNTSNNINEIVRLVSTSSSNSIYRQNLLNMLQSQWFMMTIVFEDNMPINDFENGLSVKVYINGSLYQTATFAAMLKQNNGNFFLFPNGSVDQCKISSFNYYNYAQGEAEIQATMGKGPSSTAQTSLTSSFIQPLALSDYNIMDIYNI